MKIFDFLPEERRAIFEKQGWVHITQGLTVEFLETARSIVAESAAAGRLAGRGIAGAKEQLLFEFNEEEHYGELFDTVAAVCGLDREAVTLSERHIKIYAAAADPSPMAHKDRFSSQISMGLSLEVPPGSRLVLYPDDDVWENPFLTTALRDNLEPDRAPEVVLRDAREVVIHDRPGDVVVFRGSALWHLRRNSATTVNVYLKFNDFGCDPLGEDPTTPVRRAETVALVERVADEELVAVVPVLARQFESVSREYRREGWPDRLFSNVWGRHPFLVSEEEYALLQAVDGRRTVQEVVAAVEVTDGPAAVRRLAQCGALDLLIP